MDTTIGQAAQVEELDEHVAAQDQIHTPDPESPSLLNRLLTAETGPGPLSGYTDHALNFTHDEGGSRLARGMTGLFDNLNLAIVDLAVGVIQLAINWRRKSPGGIPHVGS